MKRVVPRQPSRRLVVAQSGQGRQVFHGARRTFRGENVVLVLPRTQEISVEDDVGVEDLAGDRVHARRAHSKRRTCRDPAEGIVVDVFRIPIGVVGLLPHFDGVGKPGLLERLVPFEDSLADRLAVLEGDRFLDPKDDRSLRRREFGARIGLLEVPTIDVAKEPVVVRLLREVLHRGKEIPHPVIGQPRLVPCLRQEADGVVDVDGQSAAVGHGVEPSHSTGRVGGRHFKLHVVPESLDRCPVGLVAGKHEPWKVIGDLRQIGHEDPRQIDHVAAAGTHGDDRQAEEHAVGVCQADRALFRAAFGGGEPHVPPYDLDLLVYLAELPKPVVAESPTHATEDRILADAARDRRDDNEIPIQHAGAQFCKELVLFAIQFHQPLDGVSVLEHLRERRKTRFGVAAGCCCCRRRHGNAAETGGRWRLSGGLGRLARGCRLFLGCGLILARRLFAGLAVRACQGRSRCGYEQSEEQQRSGADERVHVAPFSRGRR